jgi:aryl-alcohol dehydrogenase-like predicted oxidoreductase
MRIGVGTAQFGLNYGITNPGGMVGEEEIAAILALAARAGIDTLDTASLYGSSEEALGRHSSAAFRIVTKTPKFSDAPSVEAAADQLRESFGRSLERLGRQQVYALLFHDAGDLLGSFGGALWQAMEDIKASGRAAKIGLSVYEGDDIDRALAHYSIDIVQLPWSPLDQRMAQGGQLARLAEAGVEVHARSLFLQGLLLEEPANLPDKFAPIAEASARMRSKFENAGLTVLEGIFALAFEQREIHRFICGVTSAFELEQIVKVAQNAEELEQPLQIDFPHNLHPRLLNPARWDELGP